MGVLFSGQCKAEPSFHEGPSSGRMQAEGFLQVVCA